MRTRLMPARFRILGSTIGVLLLGAATVLAGEPKEIRIPMRDGTKLAADLYLPEGEGPWPTVLSRTPYGKGGTGRDRANHYGPLGYAVVSQDVRGRGGSEGFYGVFGDDGWGKIQDGYDTVEWIASQAWSNGKIGTWGGSALGLTQLLMAGARPPHLVCQYVAVAPSNFYGITAYQGGIYRKSLSGGWHRAQNAPYKIEEHKKHPTHDAYWDDYDIAKRAPEIRVPIVHLGGWYDIFAQGTIDCFVSIQERGGPGARGNQRLVMGPWTHLLNVPIAGELRYADATIDIEGYGKRWFACWMKGEKNGIDGEPPVRYYVMGDTINTPAPGNEWRTADHWPPFPTKETPFYLYPGGRLDLERPTSPGGSESYVHDPKNPVPTLGGANLLIAAGPRDQRAIGDRADVLKFRTKALEKPVEVTGHVFLDLHASSDAPDTDFMAKLIDTYPDGREMLVSDGALRARFRNGFTKQEFLSPGAVYRFRIDLWTTSIIINAGHRIAVHVQSSNSPRFEVNPNSGPEPGPRPARNTIHFNRDHPSALLLPLPSRQ